MELKVQLLTGSRYEKKKKRTRNNLEFVTRSHSSSLKKFKKKVFLRVLKRSGRSLRVLGLTGERFSHLR